MRRIAFAVAVAAVAGVATYMESASGQSSGDAAPIYGVKIPDGYRDWRLISVKQLTGKQLTGTGGELKQLRAELGNDIAIKAYREGKLPFPDGAIIARVAWSYVPSEENNRVFGRAQSFVAGSPTNVQFMVKNSKDYASTGGWGYTQFSGGKPAHVDVRACYACHVPVKDRDFLFTRYSP